MAIRLLIIDARSEGTALLEQALAASGFEVVDVVAESGDIHGRVKQLQPDAIIIDSESPTRDTLEGLAMIGRQFPRPIVMLSERGGTDLVRSAAQIGISAYVVDGVSPVLVRSLIEVAMVHFKSQRLLLAELSETQQKMQDRQVVDRARCLLMEREHLSEQDAYQRLRRLAMDRAQRLPDLARAVIAAATRGSQTL